MIRDLEAEGVLPAKAQNLGSGELSMFMAMVNVQGDIKKLRDDVARQNEVICGLAAKVRALEGLQQPVEVKGTWVTGGMD
jgi:hypothetical protein